MNAAVHASGSRSADIHVQLSAPSGLLWEGEVPGDGSHVFGFVLREAVVALQQHPGVLTLLIDTMVLSPSNALGLFTPGHSYDVMVFVAESPQLLQTWFAKWRHHTDFMPALVDSSDEEDFVPGPEYSDSDSNDDAEEALRERQVRGVSHCHFTWRDHVDVSLLARAAHPSFLFMIQDEVSLVPTMVEHMMQYRSMQARKDQGLAPENSAQKNNSFGRTPIEFIAGDFMQMRPAMDVSLAADLDALACNCKEKATRNTTQRRKQSCPLRSLCI
mgnify:FL=1